MAKIWFKEITVAEANERNKNTLMEQLGIRITAIGDNFLEGEMPVDFRTHQIHGILHGGASAALAETLGSWAGSLCLDQERSRCVGVELNCSHVRSVASGLVRGRAEPLHLGRTIQVWEIKITLPDSSKLVCASRLTLAVLHNPSA